MIDEDMYREYLEGLNRYLIAHGLPPEDIFKPDGTFK